MQNIRMEIRQAPITGTFPVNVMVVDDHPNTADMLARAISRISPDIEVYATTSGQDAVEHAKDKVVDILITDMMMPEMTGLKLIETLSMYSLSSTVFFILTAYDSTELRESAQRANVKQVITKPVSPERVCQLVVQTVEELKKEKPAHIEPVTQETPNSELSIGDEIR